MLTRFKSACGFHEPANIDCGFFRSISGAPNAPAASAAGERRVSLGTIPDYAFPPGAKVTVTYQRDGKTSTVEATLVAR